MQDVETSFTSEVATLVGINFEKFNEELFKYTYQGLSDGVKIKATLKDKTSLSSINDFTKIVVEYVKLTDQEKLVNIKIALEALDTTDKTKVEFNAIAFVVDDANSMLNPTTITALGITYAIPSIPVGIKIQITKVVNEATIAFSITSTSETIAITGTITITKFVSQINRDILDVKTLIQNMANNGKSNPTKIMEVDSATFDQSAAKTLGLIWDAQINDIEEIDLTYSHNTITSNGDLNVKIKIAKFDGETQNVNIDVTITGIDEAKVVQDILDVQTALNKIGDFTKTISTNIAVVVKSANEIFSAASVAKLGIVIPIGFDPKGTTLTYSHLAINNDGDYDISVYINKGDADNEQIVTITTTINGLADAAKKRTIARDKRTIARDSRIISTIKKSLELIKGSKITVTKAIALVNIVSKKSFDEIVAASLDISWGSVPSWDNTTLTYSHSGITADGSLYVKIKIEKGKIVQYANIIVAVTGIDKAKVVQDISDVKEALENITDSTKTISAPIDVVTQGAGVTFSTASLAKLGIVIPVGFDPKGTTLTYSHLAINNDGDYDISVYINKGDADNEQIATITTTISGLATASTQAKITTDSSTILLIKNALEQIHRSKIDSQSVISPISSDSAFNKQIADDTLGIDWNTYVLPIDLQGVTLTYSHNGISVDGNLFVKIKISKGQGVVQYANIIVVVTGIDKDIDNTEINRIKLLVDNTAIVAKTVGIDGIAPVDSDTSFTQNLATDLGLTFNGLEAGDIAKLTYSHDGIFRDGVLSVIVKITVGEQSKTTTLEANIVGINEAKDNKDISDVKAALTTIVGSEKIISVNIAAVVKGTASFSTKSLAKLGIFIPTSFDSKGTILTYSHSIINSDSKYEVSVHINKNGKTEQTAIIETTISGFADASTQATTIAHSSTILEIKKVLELIKGSKKRVNSAISPVTIASKESFDSVAASNLGINWNAVPGNLKSTTLTYSHGGIIADGNLYVSIKIAKGQGVAQYANIIVAVTGIDENIDNDEINRIKLLVNRMQIVNKSIDINGIELVYEYINFDARIATSLGFTFHADLINDVDKLTYKHKGISVNGDLDVIIKIIVGKQSQTITLTAKIVGINEAKANQDILDVKVALDNLDDFSAIITASINQVNEDNFDDVIKQKFGIYLPLSFNQKGTTLTYSHDAINVNKIYVIKIYIVKSGGMKVFASINVNIIIDDSN